MPKFNSDIITARLRRLRELMEKSQLDAILVTRPSNRFYLSGFTADSEEDGLLVISTQGQWVVSDFRYIDQLAEESPLYTLRLAKGAQHEAIASLLAEIGVTKVGFESEHMVFQSVENLKRALTSDGGTDLVPVRDLVEELRLRKDAVEVEGIRQAASVADAALQKVLPLLRPGMTELEFAVELESTMRAMGSSKPAFTTIVASGVRGALPHGTASSKAIASGDLVTIDFGAVVGGYHSDMTRTVAVGTPSDQAKEIYELVRKAQEAGLAAVSAGKTGKDVDAAARDIIDAAGHGDKFGHGTGHGVGLAIHEGPRVSTRSDTVLEPGMVITIEPGIYISGWGGVRIEDLVVVTEDGCDVLSTFTKELLVL